jgi:hypothetical protein
MLKKTISKHHRIYPREEQVAQRKKLVTLLFTKLIARTSLILKHGGKNTAKNTFLQRNVMVKSFQNIKRLLPKQ